MVPRPDTLLLLLFVPVSLVYGQLSLNESEIYDPNESLLQTGVLNESYVDTDDYEDDKARVNASSLYVDGDLTDAVSGNDSDINSKEFNETEGFNSSKSIEKCELCAIREEDRKFRIDSIKHRILENLHFQVPPNMTGRTLPKVPRFARLLERSEVQSDSPNHYEYDDPYTYTERIFTIAKTPPPHLVMNESDVSYFRLPEGTQDAFVKKAVLWYYMRPAKQKKIVEVHIHKLKPPKSAQSPPQKVPLRYWKLYPNKARNWHQLDIKGVVQDWVDRPIYNFGLQLTAFDEHLQNLIINPPTIEGEEGYEPMIELNVIKRNYRRVRRSAMRCPINSTERRCCRYPLDVNFIDFGWDWVIAPRVYTADYCSGECRFTLQAANPHSYMQQQVGPAGPCCTATMLSALSILYFDHEHNILYTNLQDMKVERCGCS